MSIIQGWISATYPKGEASWKKVMLSDGINVEVSIVSFLKV